MPTLLLSDPRTPLQANADEIGAAYRRLAVGGMPRAERQQIADRIVQLNAEKDQLTAELLDTCERHLADCALCRADTDCEAGHSLADQLEAIEPAPAEAV